MWQLKPNDISPQLLAYDETVVTVDPAFPLLQVHGVSGEVPMDDPPTVGMVVEALLANGRGGEDEGTEWGVEDFSYALGPVLPFSVSTRWLPSSTA